jgi:hypothetical protein
MVNDMTYRVFSAWILGAALLTVLAAGCGSDSDTDPNGNGTEDATTGEETEGIECGQAFCTEEDICCLGFGDGAATAECTGPDDCDGNAIECDEGTHCEDGEVCCQSAGGSTCVPAGTCTPFSPACEGPGDCNVEEEEVCCLTGSGVECADTCEGGLLVCGSGDDCPETSPNCCSLAGVGSVCRAMPCPSRPGE